MDTVVVPKKYNFSTKEFRYNPGLDGGTYTHRFPVHKYKNHITLECELNIDENTGVVQFNVMDNNQTSYAPFYHVYCGNHGPILGKIHTAIGAELKRLGIIK